MGYSCRADAADALGRIEAASQKIHGAKHSALVVNNAGVVVGFYEVNRQREHADGSITGTVIRMDGTFPWPIDENYRIQVPARRAGSFKISGDGEVVRFPLMGKQILAAAKDPTVKPDGGCI